MSLKKGSLVGALCAMVLAVAGVVAAQDPPQKSTVGDKVDNAVRSLKKGAQDAGEAVRQQYEKTRTSIHNMGVASRVYGRLHWDKALAGAKVEVDVRRDGVATLTGTVPDAVARAKAVDLTKDTVGVTTVTDRLTVQTVTSPAPAPAPVTKP